MFACMGVICGCYLLNCLGLWRETVAHFAGAGFTVSLSHTTGQEVEQVVLWV